MKTILAVTLAFAVSGMPAQAAGMLDPLLGQPGDCYVRAYDEAHLSTHPRQMVETIFLKHNDEYQQPLSELTLSFGFTTRDGKSYEGVGICDGNTCNVEGDGGAFIVTPHKDGLRLKVDPRRGMHAEGASGFIALEETDDTVFLLYPQKPGACNL